MQLTNKKALEAWQKLICFTPESKEQILEEIIWKRASLESSVWKSINAGLPIELLASTRQKMAQQAQWCSRSTHIDCFETDQNQSCNRTWDSLND